MTARVIALPPTLPQRAILREQGQDFVLPHVSGIC